MIWIAFIIAVIIPILVVGFYRDRNEGILSVGLLFFISHIGISCLLLLFKSLYTIPLIIAHSVFWISVIIWRIKRGDSWQIPRIPPLLLLGMVIVGFVLYQNHFNYSGMVSTINGPVEMKNFSSPYPFYSDEWVAAGYSDYIVEKQKFPLLNVFNGAPFFNLLSVFYVTLAGVLQLFSLGSITGIPFVAIFFSLFILSTLYLFLRIHGVNQYLSALGVVLLVFIPNAGNFPTLGVLIAFNMGLILFLLTGASIIHGNKKLMMWYCFLTLAIYPPLVLLALPYIHALPTKNRKFVFAGIASIIAIVAAVTVYIDSDFFSNHVYKYFAEGFIRKFNVYTAIYPWIAVPFFLLPLSFLGLRNTYKENITWFWASIYALFVWFLSLVFHCSFIISSERAAFLGAIFLISLAVYFLNSKLNEKHSRIVFWLFIIVVVSIVLSGNIFKMNLYKYIPNRITENRSIRLGQKVSSNPPINSYLTDDDLRIFADISKKRFLSYPWKSLVLAVTTDNIPLQTKDSTISVRELSYIDFQNANCDEKKNLAVKHRIDYVYGQKIDCKGFTLVSNSSEGLLLYKYIN